MSDDDREAAKRMPTYYKCLTRDGKGPYSNFKWPLPKNGEVGAWVKTKGPLVMCENGIHVCTANQLSWWINEHIYTIEIRGQKKSDNNKLLVREARLVHRIETWDNRSARLFACDCAERVLPIFEKAYPDVVSVRAAIDTARLFANGKTTQKVMAAARDAAWAAARPAASAATRAAASAAACAAACAAAWDAARPAARAAAWDAARDAEREWQTNRLMDVIRGDIHAETSK